MQEINGQLSEVEHLLTLCTTAIAKQNESIIQLASTTENAAFTVNDAIDCVHLMEQRRQNRIRWHTFGVLNVVALTLILLLVLP